VSTDAYGYFEFWVDDSEYVPSQRFKIVLSHANFETKEYDDIKIIPDEPYIYYVDASATDQGAATTRADRTIKDLVDSIGAATATLVLHHSGTGNTTTYTLTTSETIPSNITLRIESGAILDGAGTLTQSGPLECGLYQVFGSSVTVNFSAGSIEKVCPEWWGNNTTPGTTDMTAEIQAAIDSLPTTGGTVSLLPTEYLISSALEIWKTVCFGGSGGVHGGVDTTDIAQTLITSSVAAGGSIIIGGKANNGHLSGGFNYLKNVTLRDFVLKPSSPGGGGDGIIFDGSDTLDGDRGPLAYFDVKNVGVREFALDGFNLIGNVFMGNFFSCNSALNREVQFNTETTTVNVGLTHPSQINIYGPYFIGTTAGTWVLVSNNNVSIFGGNLQHVSGGNGAQLGSYSLMSGVHMEIDGAASSNIAIQITGDGVILDLPYPIGNTVTGLKVGDGSTVTRSYMGNIADINTCTTGIDVTTGTSFGSIHISRFTSCTTDISDSIELTYFKHEPLSLHQGNSKNYYPVGKQSKTVGIGWGYLYPRHSIDYDESNTKWVWQSMNAGGSRTTRLEVDDAQNTETWEWQNSVHKDLRIGSENVVTITATDSITFAEHAGNINLLGEVGGDALVTLTLPEATGSGDIYKFIVSVVNTSNYVIATADAANCGIYGTLNILDVDSNAQTAYAGVAADDKITLNGTTTGGQIGDWLELTDIATDQWSVRGNLVCPAGSDVADPFSST
jgi:hypothetical protein